MLFLLFLCEELKKVVKRVQMSGKCQIDIVEITRETNNFAVEDVAVAMTVFRFFNA